MSVHKFCLCSIKSILTLLSCRDRSVQTVTNMEVLIVADDLNTKGFTVFIRIELILAMRHLRGCI